MSSPTWPPSAWLQRYPALWVAALGAILFLPGLGNHGLWNPDEPRYAQVAAEMLASGEFMVPHLNGELYNQKPPLHFWSIAAFGSLRGGVDEVAARLPSALAGIGILVLVFLIGRRLFDDRTAWLAVLVFGSSARLLWQGRTGQIDMQLVFWVTLSMYLFVRGHLASDPRWYPWFFVACGFGGLAKGPVGLLPPLLSIVAYLWVTGQRQEVKQLRIGRGLLIWIGIMCLWLLPAALTAGFDYLRYLVIDQNLGRYARPSGHHRPFYYFLTVIPGDFFPWSFFLPTALILGWRRLRSSVETAAKGEFWLGAPARRGFLLCLCWMVVTVVFFSLSPGKRTVYVLTMYPGMSLLVAAVLQRLMAQWGNAQSRDTQSSDTQWLDRAEAPGRAWMMVPLGLLTVLLGTAAALLPSRVGERPELALMKSWTLPLVTGGVALLALAALVGLVLVWRGRASWAPRVLAVTMMAMVVTLFLAVLPQVDPFKSPRRLTERLSVERLPDEPFAVFPRKDASVIFYAGQPVLDVHPEELDAFLTSAPRVWLLAERNALGREEPARELVEVDRDADVEDGYLLLTNPPWPRAPASTQDTPGAVDPPGEEAAQNE